MALITVRDYIDLAQMKTDLSFSTNNLSDAMMAQAALFAHYGVLASKASKQVDSIKMVLETAEARIYRIHRDDAASSGAKITEAQLDKLVSADPKIIDIKKALNEAKQVEANGKIATEAFRHRRDMLVQMGLLSREELKGQTSIAVKNERENQAQEQRDRILERRKELQAAGA
jgi:hypothetical protein